MNMVMNSFQFLNLNNLKILKNRLPASFISSRVTYASKVKKWRLPEKNPDIPKNTIEKYITAHLQPEKGWPYDCKPFKMLLEKDKSYFWCSCGWGHNQPMCDSTHKRHYLPVTMKPVRFKVAETKEYWLCCCKQTKNRPFCDGSHRDPQVQDLCKDKVVATG